MLKKATYADPAAAHRKLKPAYTEAQWAQMCAWGLFDEPRCSLTTEQVARVHYEAVHCNTTGARSDDCGELLLTSNFLLTPRHLEGSQVCHLVCTAVDSGKTIKDSHVEYTGSMRHNGCPTLCPQFADAWLALVQHRVAGRPPPECVPRPRADGMMVRPWYDEMLLHKGYGSTVKHVEVGLQLLTKQGFFPRVFLKCIAFVRPITLLSGATTSPSPCTRRCTRAPPLQWRAAKCATSTAERSQKLRR